MARDITVSGLRLHFQQQGVREINLHGVELDEERVAYVCEHLPVDALCNAITFGWEHGVVRLSTLFTSILDDSSPSANRVGIDSLSGTRRVGVVVAQS